MRRLKLGWPPSSALVLLGLRRANLTTPRVNVKQMMRLIQSPAAYFPPFNGTKSSNKGVNEQIHFSKSSAFFFFYWRRWEGVLFLKTRGNIKEEFGRCRRRLPVFRCINACACMALGAGVVAGFLFAHHECGVASCQAAAECWRFSSCRFSSLGSAFGGRQPGGESLDSGQTLLTLKHYLQKIGLDLSVTMVVEK